MDRDNKTEIYASRLSRTMELVETVKELSKGKDRFENPKLSEEMLELRFWKRSRKQKDMEKSLP